MRNFPIRSFSFYLIRLNANTENLKTSLRSKMRLKIAMSRDPRHAEAVIGVGWINNDETVSCGDDQKLLRWNLLNAEAHMMTQLSGFFWKCFIIYKINQARILQNMRGC